MDTWMKIGSALLIGMMLVVIFPRVRQSMKESPKGSADDWRSALIPLLLVIGFVVLLIMLIR
jgi:general stress protein CsbA